MIEPFEASRGRMASCVRWPACSHGTPRASCSKACAVVLPISLGFDACHATKRAAMSSASNAPRSTSERAMQSAICVSSVISPGATFSQPPPMMSRNWPCWRRMASGVMNSSVAPKASPAAAATSAPR
jgi:hypothetical protein